MLTCIYNGNLEDVKKLVKKDDLDKESVPNAVDYAVQCGNPEILDWLLDNGWDANPEQYDSVLAKAYKINCKIVKVLLKCGAELNDAHEDKHWINEDYKQSPLHYAIRTKQPCMVKATLECDVDAAPGSSYYPPLLEAIHHAHKNIVVTEKICRLLVKYGADPDREGEVRIWQEKKKINPAEYLLNYHITGSGSLLSFLISHGADAKVKADDIEKIFTVVDILKNDNELLDDYPEAKTRILRSYLAAICLLPDSLIITPEDIKMHDEIFRVMKKHGIDFNQPLPGGRDTPLLLAAKNKQDELCKLFIKHGASPDKKVNGESPRQYLK